MKIVLFIILFPIVLLLTTCVGIIVHILYEYEWCVDEFDNVEFGRVNIPPKCKLIKRVKYPFRVHLEVYEGDLPGGYTGVYTIMEKDGIRYGFIDKS